MYSVFHTSCNSNVGAFQKKPGETGFVHHNIYFFALIKRIHAQSIITALCMAYLASQKYTTVAIQIQSLQFYYCLRSVPPSWIANLGYVGLFRNSEWQISI